MRFLLWAVSLILLGLIGLRALHAPLKDEISWSTAVFDENGELLRLTLSADEKYRLFTPLKDFPPAFVNTVLFKEDRYYRWHAGVNPLAAVRAAFQTFVTGGRRIGGSTISMQLARLYYGVPSRSIAGKIKQMAAAFWLEALYSKDEVLEAYLNLLPYGSNVEGAGSASLIYFGKKPERLNLPEMLSLAVIPQSPRLRASGARGEIQSTHRLIQARDRLFDLMLDVNAISASDRASLKPPLHMYGTHDLPFKAPHFVEWILTRSRQPTVQTTLNVRSQKLLETRLAAYLRRQKALGVNNAAALLVDWTNHEIKAMVGSADFLSGAIAGQVNGTLALRSPGSTLKPFAYGLAFDQGLIHSQSLLKDAPAAFGGFDPENFDRDFQGPISAEEALSRSRNVPAVQIVSELKNPGFFQFLGQTGLRLPFSEEFYGLSTVLGGAEVTMLDLVRLYSLLPNAGQLHSVISLKGEKPVYQGRKLSPEAAFMVMEILKKVPRPAMSGGNPWARASLKAHWKTGTSHGFRDAWTVGVFGKYVLAVWLGNFDGKGSPSFIGRDLAAPLFFEIAEALNATERLTAESRWPTELNVKREKVCSVSGRLPGPHCPHTKWTWFIPGVSPIQTCDIHREILVSQQTGLRLCRNVSTDARREVHEFWPSDLLKIFAQAGLARVKPPEWDSHCRLDDLATSGQPPSITSPKEGVIYSLRAGGGESRVSLGAVTDGDVRETFWFVDNAFVGKSKPRELLFWPAKPGSHLVRVVDDQGRSDATRLRVQVEQ